MIKIGKYEISGMIGQGGMGVVYKAFDPLLQREVAIKVISEKAFENPDIKERFFREARAAARLLHENITVVHDLGEHDGKPYIVMEYLTGSDLRSVLNAIKENTREPLSLPQKLDYARQICKGFEFLHAKDIVHRDLKPENIRIIDDGKAKIMDFGIAKSMSMASTMTQMGMVLGTPGYMSPEQIRGQKVDKRSDLFSFGILFYELLTNKMPFKGSDLTSIWYNIVHEPPQQIEDLEIESLAPVREIILKALKKEPNERYQNFTELLEDLETIIKLKEAELKRLTDEKRKIVQALLADGNNFLKKKNFARALEKADEASKLATDQRSVREFIALIKDEEEKENRRRWVDEKIKAAQKLAREKQYQQALALLRETLRIQPEQAEALKLVQEVKDGIRLEEEKQHLERLLAQGRDYLNQNDLTNAERVAVEVLKLAPQSSAVLRLFDAVKLKKEEEAKKKRRIEESMQNARQWIQDEQYEAAIEALQLVLQEAPGHAGAAKLIQEAETGITRREEQRRIENLLANGRNYLNRNEFANAQKIVDEVLAARPQYAEALKLAEAIAKKKEDEEKKKRLIAEKLDSARKFVADEKYHKAIGVLKEILKLAPNHAEARNLLQEVEATIQRLTAAEEEPPAETKWIEARIDETILVEPEPVVKRPPRPPEKPRRPPVEKTPFQFKRAHLIAAAVVLLVGAGLAYRLFIYVPPLPVGYVALNILPWAEVTRIETSEGQDVTAAYAANGKIITPCRLMLPEGNYKISLVNPAYKEPLTVLVAVKAGEFQEVKQKISGFDYNNILPQF